MPLITVLMPVYDAMPFLPEAVNSVLNQTFRDFRLLVLDDGSTDKTGEYLASVRDDRVVVVKRSHLGLGATLNFGLKYCDTQYIARMDGDDLIHPERFVSQIDYMERRPDVCMVGCQVEFLVNSRTGIISRVPTEHAAIVGRLLKGKSGLCSASALMRAECVFRTGGYRIIGAGEDLDFCLRMAETGKLANLENVYYFYRLLRTSLSFSRRTEMRIGYSYALDSARCRITGQPEPALDTIQLQWQKRTALRRGTDLLEDWAVHAFRLSVIDRAEGRYCASILRLVCAGVAQPQWVFWRVHIVMHSISKRIAGRKVNRALAKTSPRSFL